MLVGSHGLGTVGSGGQGLGCVVKAVSMGFSAVKSCLWWRWLLAMCREVAMQDGKRAPDTGAVGVHEHR